jgi:hypothetical protein
MMSQCGACEVLRARIQIRSMAWWNGSRGGTEGTAAATSVDCPTLVDQSSSTTSAMAVAL